MRLSSFTSFICSLCLTLTPALQANPIRVNGIAAKVNGDVITMNELMIKLAPVQSTLMAQYPRRGATYEMILKKQRDELLDELIDRTIIYTEYKDRITNIPDQAVEEDIQNYINRVYAGDDALFRKYLQATNLTRDQFKEQQRKELLVQIVRSQQFPDLAPPTEAELKKEYGEWKIKNRDRKKDVGSYLKIYLRKGIDKEASLQKAEHIVAELKAGGNFAALAKEYSTDSRASDGGLWKDVPRTDLNHEFGFIVFDIPGEEITGPLEDQFGFTILKVVERKLGPAEPLSKVREKIKSLVNARKKKASFDIWMKKLRNRTPVEKLVGR